MSLRKILLIVLAVIVLMPATSNATISRVIGMGGYGANWIVMDAANSMIWPQLVKHYGMQGGAEFYTGGNGWDFQKAYINYDFGSEKSVLQFAIDQTNERDFGWGDMYNNNPLASLDAITGGYNKLNITYGRPIGDDMLLGIGLNYGGKSFADDADGTDNSYSQMGLLVGLTAMENKLDASIGFETGSWQIGNDAGTFAEDDGAGNIMIAGRYWHTLNDHYKIIPNIGLMMHNDGVKYGSPSSAMPSWEYSSMDLKLGCGNNWTPKENMLAIADFGFHMMAESATPDDGDAGTDDKEATNDEMDLYWRLGLESKIFGWLDGRFGAERAWVGMAFDDGSGDVQTTGAPQSYTYLGATAHWNRFVADVIVNPDFLGWGPNFVSGYNDMLFWRTSLKINFDKE